MKRFGGRVVLVTGGTAGIGLATVKRFVEEGATVLACSRKQENVDQVCRELKCDGLVCNVSSDHDRVKLVEYIKNKYGRIDVIVLNAATSLSFGPSRDCEPAKWDKMMETNLKSNWVLSNMLASLITPKTGSIVLVSSYAGYNPDSPLGVYAVTKTALIGLTKMLANEFGRAMGVRVNCVAPGVIETRFSRPLWESEEIRKITENASPLGRVGKPEEVSGPIVFLASEDASYITGDTLVIAGGSHCRL